MNKLLFFYRFALAELTVFYRIGLAIAVVNYLSPKLLTSHPMDFLKALWRLVHGTILVLVGYDASEDIEPDELDTWAQTWDLENPIAILKRGSGFDGEYTDYWAEQLIRPNSITDFRFIVGSVST